MRAFLTIQGAGLLITGLVFQAAACGNGLGTSGTGAHATASGAGGAGGATSASTTTSTGATSASSTTSAASSGGGGGGDCASEPAAQCVACCGAADPQGLTVLLDDAAACVCAPNACETECGELCSAVDGGSLDGGAFGGAACQTCVSGLLKTADPCIAAALIKCKKDADCKAFLTCEGACPTQ